MKSPRFFLSLVLAAVFVLTLFFNRVLIFQGLNSFRSLVFGFFNKSFDYQRFRELEAENKGLKAELQRFKEKYQLSASESYITGRVYSAYPFSDRRLIVIDLGEGNGVKSGMPVLAKEGVLLGKIKDVRNSLSIVETIFDPKWRSSVVMGGKTKALLEGGVTPVLTLIPKDAEIISGEEVFNTSPEFPLGLFLGRVKKVRAEKSDVWQSAELEILYKPEELNEIFVVKNFP